jgi:hypothetical protein
VETAIEPERMQVPEDPEERFLVDIAGVLGGAEKIHGQPEHTLVICPDQLLKSILVARLGRPDQIIYLWTHAGAQRSSGICHNSRYIYQFPASRRTSSVDVDALVVILSRLGVRFWDGRGRKEQIPSM